MQETDEEVWFPQEIVGTAWPQQEGKILKGDIVLPRPLPAGIKLNLVLIYQQKGRQKPRYRIEVEVPAKHQFARYPLPEDIWFEGELMTQHFKPPRPSNRRLKVLLWGPSGTAKTVSALQFPKCAYIDNHGSAELYEPGYPDHLFAHPKNPDETMAAVEVLLKDPGGCLTVVLDDVTTYWGQVQEKWAGLFLTRLPRSKGHHAEFYSFQPSDWIHPKREQKTLLQRLIAMDLNVVLIARAKKAYAGSGEDFMRVVGEIFAGEPNLPYEFDYIIELGYQGQKRMATVHKQRVPVGGKTIPAQFEFAVNDQGKSNLFEIIKEYTDPRNFDKPAHQIPDPVSESIPQAAPTDSIAPEPQNPAPVEPPRSPEPTVTPSAGPLSNHQPSPDQLNELREMKSYFKIENAEWGKTLQKFYNVTTAKALTPDQANHFINYLRNQRAPF